MGLGTRSALPVKAGGGGLLIFVAFQREGGDSDIKVGAIRSLKSESTPAKREQRSQPGQGHTQPGVTGEKVTQELLHRLCRGSGAAFAMSGSKDMGLAEGHLPGRVTQ